MGSRRIKPFYWPIVIAPLMAVGLVVALVVLRPAQDRALADYWRDEIVRMPDARVAKAVEQLTLTGDAAIPVLTELLASPRASVAESARRALLDETDRWTMLPADDEARNLALLAQSLADNIDSYGPAGQGLATQFAQQILTRPVDGQAIDRLRLLANCDHVLQSAASDPSRSANSWRDTSFDPLADAQRSPSVGSGAPEVATIESDFSAVPPVPGGGLAFDAAQVPSRPVPYSAVPRNPALHNGRWPPVVTDPREPRALPRPSTRVPTLPAGPPQPPRELPIYRHAQPVPHGISPATHVDNMAARGNSQAVDEKRSLNDTHLPIARRRAISVMRLLRSANQAEVQAATHELKRRGMGPTELQLARALTDADPKIRRGVIDSLVTSQVKPRPWLLTLGEDRDADVRLAALAAMATSGDPQLTRSALELARHDDDPRIVAIARRLEDRRDKR